MATDFTINTRSTHGTTFEAIVIGSGISGGWAAKELCELGLRTLLLDRGRNVEHIHDYPTANLHPWELDLAAQHSNDELKRNPIQSQWSDGANKHFFVDDAEHPYIQVNPFNWIRGYQVGADL